MQVALHRSGGHTDVVVLEIVSARETDIPSVTQSDVTAEVKSLAELIRIAHRLSVELAAGVLSHGDTISYCQRPWH